MLKALLSSLLGLFGFLLLTCGPSGAEEDNVQRITLNIGNYAFEPDTLEVYVGQPVELTLVNNDRLIPHNFTLKSKSAGLDLHSDVSGGKTVVLRFTPEIAGNFTFYCKKEFLFMKSHRKHGMEGTLVVREAP